LIMDVFKILALCLTAAAVCLVLRQKNPEYALFVACGSAIVITVYLLKSIWAPIETIRYKIEAYGIETEYFKTALKAVGIGYVTSFIADACRDSGQASLAGKAELAGKCAIFILCCPLMLSVLETAVGFIK